MLWIMNMVNSRHFAQVFFKFMYSDTQKTLKLKDDFFAKIKCIWCCCKENSFTRHLLNHWLCEMCLFTLHNWCVPCLLDYLTSYFKSKSRLPISKFSGYHCTNFWLWWQDTNVAPWHVMNNVRILWRIQKQNKIQ